MWDDNYADKAPVPDLFCHCQAMADNCSPICVDASGIIACVFRYIFMKHVVYLPVPMGVSKVSHVCAVVFLSFYVPGLSGAFLLYGSVFCFYENVLLIQSTGQSCNKSLPQCILALNFNNKMHQRRLTLYTVCFLVSRCVFALGWYCASSSCLT